VAGGGWGHECPRVHPPQGTRSPSPGAYANFVTQRQPFKDCGLKRCIDRVCRDGLQEVLRRKRTAGTVSVVLTGTTVRTGMRAKMRGMIILMPGMRTKMQGMVTDTNRGMYSPTEVPGIVTGRNRTAGTVINRHCSNRAHLYYVLTSRGLATKTENAAYFVRLLVFIHINTNLVRYSFGRQT